MGNFLKNSILYSLYKARKPEGTATLPRDQFIAVFNAMASRKRYEKTLKEEQNLSPIKQAAKEISLRIKQKNAQTTSQTTIQVQQSEPSLLDKFVEMRKLENITQNDFQDEKSKSVRSLIIAIRNSERHYYRSMHFKSMPDPHNIDVNRLQRFIQREEKFCIGLKGEGAKENSKNNIQTAQEILRLNLIRGIEMALPALKEKRDRLIPYTEVDVKNIYIPDKEDQQIKEKIEIKQKKHEKLDELISSLEMEKEKLRNKTLTAPESASNIRWSFEAVKKDISKHTDTWKEKLANIFKNIIDGILKPETLKQVESAERKIFKR